MTARKRKQGTIYGYHFDRALFPFGYVHRRLVDRFQQAVAEGAEFRIPVDEGSQTESTIVVRFDHRPDSGPTSGPGFWIEGIQPGVQIQRNLERNAAEFGWAVGGAAENVAFRWWVPVREVAALVAWVGWKIPALRVLTALDRASRHIPWDEDPNAEHSKADKRPWP